MLNLLLPGASRMPSSHTACTCDFNWREIHVGWLQRKMERFEENAIHVPVGVITAYYKPSCYLDSPDSTVGSSVLTVVCIIGKSLESRIWI